MDGIEANIPDIEANIPPHQEKRHKQMDGIEANIPPRREKYDVYISFTGEDTRLGLTSHLRAALLQKKIEPYIDSRLQRGQEIGPALLEAIEKSTHSVIIFSQNYASSTWCLDELVHILKCNERYGQKVIPVFYDINPSDVRKQHGSYAGAFAQLENRFKDSVDKVHKWRNALTTAANLSGFDYSNKHGTEADLIENVVDHIWSSVNNMENSAEWIFLVTSLCMEILSAAFDQASSPRRPGYALFGMLLAIAALLTCIWELIYKGRKNNGMWGKRVCYMLFGSVNESFGLLGGIAQCVCSIVQYVYYIRRANNPIKLSLLPAILIICLIATRLSRKRMQTTYETREHPV